MKRCLSRNPVGLLAGPLAIALLLAGCTLATDLPSKNGTVSGKVRDRITGQAVSGASIVLGSTTVTSSATGAYSLDFGQSSGTANKDMTVFAAGYQATYMSGVSVDTGKSYNGDINLAPVDTSAYSKVAISGKVFEKQTDASTPTELPSTWTVSVTVMNKFGYQSSSSFSYTNGTGFATGVSFYRLTSDSLVYVYATPPNGSSQHGFGIIATGVDLSGASATVDATEDLAIEKTVTLTADGMLTGTIGTAPYSFYMGQLALVTPYGQLRQLQASSGSASSTISFIGSNTFLASYVNPSSYPVSLTQIKADAQTTLSLTQATLATGGAIGTAAALPAISSSITLTVAPDVSTIAYNAATGTLSLAPVTGTTSYSFYLQDNTTKFYLASITSTSATVVLSPALKAALSGKTIDVSVTCVNTDLPLDMDYVFQVNPVTTVRFASVSGATIKTGVSF